MANPPRLYNRLNLLDVPFVGLLGIKITALIDCSKVK